MEETKKNFSFEDMKDIWREELGVFTWFHFTIGSCQYEMTVEDKKSEKTQVYHRSQKDEDDCPFCNQQETICDRLDRESREIFHYITNRPEIRLRWLLESD